MPERLTLENSTALWLNGGSVERLAETALGHLQESEMLDIDSVLLAVCGIGRSTVKTFAAENMNGAQVTSNRAQTVFRFHAPREIK